MNLSSKRIRLRAVWMLVPVFLILARPAPETLAAGAVFALLGAAVRAWASGTIQKNVVLTTTGPYAYTRNPLYVGTFLVGLGVTAAAGSVVLVALFLTFFTMVYVQTMRVEERKLEALFGEAYREYAAAVPLFFPRLRPYRAGAGEPTSFTMSRYLGHREWELLLGLTATFVALIAKMSIF